LKDEVVFERKLNRVETTALSIACIAMTAGMALGTPLIVGAAGTSGPLVLILSTIGVLCIAFSFVRLSSRVGHAGSVYGLVRYAQGRSIGFIAGWALLLTYGMFVSSALAGFGIFASFVINPFIHLPWAVYSLSCGVVVWITNYRDIKLSTRIVLAIEVVSIALVTILSFVIVSKQPATALPFKLSSTGFVGFSHAIVYGIMTFVGFEAAASLGEEAHNPSKDIPFAIIGTVIAAGIFFTLVTYAQTVGYGIPNIQALASATTPLSDLTSRYLGQPATMIVNIGCAVSAFAMAVGSAAAASRLVLALARDGFLTPTVTPLNRFGSPGIASRFVMALNFALLIALILSGCGFYDVFAYTSTIATLTAVIAYGMMAAATFTRFVQQDLQNKKLYLSVIPVIGLALMAYTMFVNVYPMPAYPFNILTYVVIAWMVVGGIIATNVRQSQRQGDISSYLVTRPTEHLSAVISENPLRETI
jgi:amino acid transporter